jgi:hypothetical protein
MPTLLLSENDRAAALALIANAPAGFTPTLVLRAGKTINIITLEQDYATLTRVIQSIASERERHARHTGGSG